MKGVFMGVTFKLIKKIGTVGESSKGEKKLQLVSWNGGEPVYDLRTWLSDGKATSGVTFSKEDLLRIVEIYKNNGAEEEVEEETEEINIDALFSMNEPEEESEEEPTEEEKEEQVVEEPKKRGRKPKAEKQEEPAEKPVAEKKTETKSNIIQMPQPKADIEPAKTDTNYTYADCEAKFDEIFKDVAQLSNYAYVLMGLKEMAQVDDQFVQNAMREDRTFSGMMRYLSSKARKNSVKISENEYVMDDDRALAICLDYFNEKEVPKVEKPKEKPKTTTKTKSTTKKTVKKVEDDFDIDDELPFN